MFLVTGATGGLGRRIVHLLRDRDIPVRAFVRLNAHYSDLEQRGAEIFIGDLRQERDIIRACQNIDSIISAHGSGSSPASPQVLDYRANIDLIDQAKATGVKHFVFISVLGADRGYEDAPVFKAKHAVERYLIHSGLTYTILRPSGFASNLLPAAERFRQTSFYPLIGDSKSRTSIVSTDDLAQISIASVEQEAAQNQIFAVGGPEILHREDIPRIFGRVFNREPVVANLPLFLVDGARSVLGIIDPEAQQNLGTFRTLLANEFFCTPQEIDQLERTYNIKMETLESFIRRYLSA